MSRRDDKRADRKERRDAKRTDKTVDEAVKKHGPGVEALAEAVRRINGKAGGR